MPSDRGSVRADAVAVSGLTRHILSSRVPDRPGKLRGTVRKDSSCDSALPTTCRRTRLRFCLRPGDALYALRLKCWSGFPDCLTSPPSSDASRRQSRGLLFRDGKSPQNSALANVAHDMRMLAATTRFSSTKAAT